MAKKNKISEQDPLSALEEQRDQLQERFDALTGKVRGEIGDVGFWGVVGGFALVADWTFLGGFGTMLAVMSGAGAIAYRAKATAVGKELSEIQTRILDMQEARFNAQLEAEKHASKNAPKNDNSLRDEFSPAARSEIEALQKKLADLQGQVGDLQKDKEQGLDKPKFKAPFGKKPGQS